MVTSVLAGFNEFIKVISISGDQQATSTARKDRIVDQRRSSPKLMQYAILMEQETDAATFATRTPKIAYA